MPFKFKNLCSASEQQTRCNYFKKVKQPCTHLFYGAERTEYGTHDTFNNKQSMFRHNKQQAIVLVTAYNKQSMFRHNKQQAKYVPTQQANHYIGGDMITVRTCITLYTNGMEGSKTVIEMCKEGIRNSIKPSIPLEYALSTPCTETRSQWKIQAKERMKYRKLLNALLRDDQRAIDKEMVKLDRALDL